MRRIHILISGTVQGVFFRSFIKYHANLLKLKGYAKNTQDGNVEAILEGPEQNIKKIVELCKKGPEGAKVTNIKIKEEKIRNEFKDFEIRY